MDRPSAFLRFLLAILALTLLAGCHAVPQAPATEDPTNPVEATVPMETEATRPEIEFIISAKSFSEQYGDYYDRKRSFTTCYNGITYHFDVAIEEDERIDIILQCDTLAGILLENYPNYVPNMTLCFRPGDYPARFLNNTLFIGLDHLDTQDFAVGMAGAAFGNQVAYGLIYAQGTRLAETAGFPVVENPATLADALTVTATQPAYLDLSYPCFLEEYADADTLAAVRVLAMHFYDYLEKRQQLDLLTDYSDSRYCEHLSQFLVENGQAPYDNADLEGTIFYFGGPKIRLVWETADACFYLEDAFKTQYDVLNQSDRMNADYPTLRKTIVDYHEQIDFIESKLGKFETDSSHRVNVLFAAGHATDRYSMANYSSSENLILMFCSEPLLHEYGHYLLRDTGIDSWLNEVICYYYGYIPVNEEISYLWRSEVDIMESATGVEASFIQQLKYHLNEELDWTNPAHFTYMFTGYLALYDNYSVLINPDAGAEAKVSFLDYLIDIAGEEAAIAAIVAQEPEAAFGKDWEGLMADWSQEVRREYKWIHNMFYIREGE